MHLLDARRSPNIDGSSYPSTALLQYPHGLRSLHVGRELRDLLLRARLAIVQGYLIDMMRGSHLDLWS